MSRILGLTLATTLTAASLLGASALIARDFLGAEAMGSLLKASGNAIGSFLAARNVNFTPGKEITFFEDVPIAGTDLVVWTGAAYDSVPAVQSLRPAKHWCYINVSSGKIGISGRIDLGIQQGDAAPEYATAVELADVRLPSYVLPPDVLAALAKTHCRFGLIDPFAKKSGK